MAAANPPNPLPMTAAFLPTVLFICMSEFSPNFFQLCKHRGLDPNFCGKLSKCLIQKKIRAAFGFDKKARRLDELGKRFAFIEFSNQFSKPGEIRHGEIVSRDSPNPCGAAELQ